MNLDWCYHIFTFNNSNYIDTIYLTVRVLQHLVRLHPKSRGWVIVCPVMQVYGSLVLEDNLEAGEAVLGRCNISRICTSAF